MLYAFMLKHLGVPLANTGIITFRAALIALVVLFSDMGFTSFTYINV